MAIGAALQTPVKANTMNVGLGENPTDNISTPTVIKQSLGRIARVSVIVAGSTNGTIYDTSTVNLTTASNRVAEIINTVGVYEIDFPVSNGIVVIPGTSQIVSISYT